MRGNALDLLQTFVVLNGRDIVPTTIDFRHENERSKHDLEGFVEALLPTHVVADGKLVREDVEVPAGHFAQVVRETLNLDGGGQATRWSSPEVPFDGTINVVRTMTSSSC